MPTFNLADLFELVVDVAADREAAVTAERRLTYAGLDDRANRFADHLPRGRHRRRRPRRAATAERN